MSAAAEKEHTISIKPHEAKVLKGTCSKVPCEYGARDRSHAAQSAMTMLEPKVNLS